MWLYNVPEHYDAIHWSEDNLIAVAAGHTVVVLSPAQLQGPRSHLSTRTPEIEPLIAGCKPKNYDSSLHLALALYGEMQAQEFGAKSTVRAVAWSPAGCTPQGGCMLTCITSDHKVTTRAAPRRPAPPRAALRRPAPCSPVAAAAAALAAAAAAAARCCCCIWGSQLLGHSPTARAPCRRRRCASSRPPRAPLASPGARWPTCRRS